MAFANCGGKVLGTATTASPATIEWSDSALHSDKKSVWIEVRAASVTEWTLEAIGGS